MGPGAWSNLSQKSGGHGVSFEGVSFGVQNLPKSGSRCVVKFESKMWWSNLSQKCGGHVV